MAENPSILLTRARRALQELDGLKDATRNLDSPGLGSLTGRLDVVKSQFCEVINKIDLANETAEEKCDTTDIYQEFMSKFYHLALVSQVPASSTPLTSQPGADGLIARPKKHPPGSVESGVALPKLCLPRFSGKIEEFPAFRGIFENLIHNSPTLDAIRKYHYLISALDGPAKTLVSHLPIDAQNYEIAYNLLINRYASERIVLDSHYNKIASFEQSANDLDTLTTFFIRTYIL